MTVSSAAQTTPAGVVAISRPVGRAAKWLGGFAVWTLLALLSAFQTAFFFTANNQPIPWEPLILGRLADWYTCAIFTPVYFWLVRRYPIDRDGWKTSLPLHLGLTSVFVVLKYVIYAPLMARLVPTETLSLGQILARNFIFESFAFWCILGVVHAMVFYERYRDREIQAAELRARLSAAQLEALAGQLHPHFLFNTLQGISTLMHRDASAADLMLSRLSELLRRTLNRGDRQEVPLREEMELLGHYVGIMEVRFGDRLVFDRQIDPAVEEALVPHFILQPLVENALQHGIARRGGRGRVEVRAEKRDASLRLTVRDDGPGDSTPTAPGPHGIGLSNTRLRLRQLYGARQRLELAPLENGGMEATLELPFHVVETDFASIAQRGTS